MKNIENKTCHTIFIPTENCNIRCEYCSRGCNKFKNSYYYASGNDFRNLLKFLKLQNYEQYTFEFFGGEPTVHPQFRAFNKMLEYFNKPLLEIHTLTNLIRPFEYWTYDWPEQTKFSCSYHSHAIKDSDEWFAKVYYLKKRGMIRDIKFIITPENEKEIIKIYEKYKSDEYEVYELVVQEQLAGTEWAEGIFKKYDADYLEDYRPKEDFYKMVCSCKFRVAENGDVYYCWRKFDDEIARPILNVFEDTLKKVPEWHLCLYHNCDICDVDNPKYSIKDWYEIQRRNEK